MKSKIKYCTLSLALLLPAFQPQAIAGLSMETLDKPPTEGLEREAKLGTSDRQIDLYGRLTPKGKKVAADIHASMGFYDELERWADIESEPLMERKRDREQQAISTNTLNKVIKQEAIKLSQAISDPGSSTYHKSLISLLDEFSDEYSVPAQESQKEKVAELLDMIDLAPAESTDYMMYDDRARADVLDKLAKVYESYWSLSDPNALNLPFLSEQPIPVADVLMMTLITITSPVSNSTYREKNLAVFNSEENDEESMVVITSGEVASGCKQWVLLYDHSLQTFYSSPDMKSKQLNNIIGKPISFTYTAGVGDTQTGLSFNHGLRINELKECALGKSNDKKQILKFKQNIWW